MGRSKEEARKLAEEQLKEKYAKNLNLLNEAKSKCIENMNEGKEFQAVIDYDVLTEPREFDFKHFYLLDKTESRTFGEVIDSDIKSMKEYQKEKYPYHQKQGLKVCLKTYLGLKYRSENQSLLDKLKHPFMSIKLFFQKLSLKSMLNNGYKISDRALEEVEKASKRTFDQNREIGYVDKDGNVYKTQATEMEIKDLARDLEKGDDLSSKIDNDLEKENVNVISTDKVNDKSLEVDKELEI